MHWLNRLFKRTRMEHDLDRELSYHLEHRIADLVASGIEPREAQRRARLEFGTGDAIKEQCRDARGTQWVHDFIQDCRHGLRLWWRSPLFATVALFSLALGIGSTTAIFSLMDRVMLRPMPVREPHRLVELVRFWDNRRTNHAYPHFERLRDGLQSIDGLLAYSWLGELDIMINGQTEPARIELASGAFYSVLGVEARIGSTFNSGVDRVPGANPVAVISEAYWERRFASDENIIGKTFRRRETVFTIIGVAPREFTGVAFGRLADITIPTSMVSQVRGRGTSWLDNAGTHWLEVMGRLKPGVTPAEARAEVSTVFAQIAAEEAAESKDERRKALVLRQRMELRAAANGFAELRREFTTPLAILMSAVTLVLLLACTNLANLLLARSAARQREIAVRLALGAGKWRVIRQMLAEALPLAILGGGLGVLTAYGMANGLVAMMANGGPALAVETHPDARVLGFALVVALSSCILFSFAPAWQAARQALQPSLAEIRAARWRLGKGLMAWQMCISVVLLIGAGLLGRTLQSIYSEPAGFHPDGVLILSTNTSRLGYTIDQMAGMPQRIVEELRTLPGIQSVSVSAFPPVSGGSGWETGFEVQDYTHSPRENNVSHVNALGPDFFRTYETPIIAGREFDSRDVQGAPLTAVVNEAFAKHYFKDGMPLGKWVSFAGFRRTDRFTIVGVVKDVKYEGLRQQAPRTVYVSMAQVPVGGHTFAIRTASSAALLTPLIEAAIARVNKELRPRNIRWMEDHVAQSLWQERLLAALASAFGVVALVLAAIGIYGMMAFQVARRRREIGIRIALGAGTGSVIGMILGQTARVTLIGCAFGVGAALLLTRGTETFLHGVQPYDPLTFAAAIAVLLAVALTAAYWPGRSAARCNPIETLRAE